MRRTLLIVAVLVAVTAACGSDGVLSTGGDAAAPDSASDEPTPRPPAGAPTAEAPTPGAAAGEVANDGLFPTVIAAEATPTGGTSWRVNVTLSSEYDTPERYADAWRVLDADDNELGIRVLLHDHANEQPFTRSETIDIPPEVAVVYVEARDQRNGWNGERFELRLTGSP